MLQFLQSIDPRTIPTILIVIDLGASIVWLSHLDVRRAIYWFAAAVLTATVTF